jgi:thiazole synthase ThiGH ThiG subunit
LGKDTAKGLAKKFSANEKVMPWGSSIGSSRGPGED